jgi:hypothetical protein
MIAANSIMVEGGTAVGMARVPLVNVRDYSIKSVMLTRPQGSRPRPRPQTSRPRPKAEATDLEAKKLEAEAELISATKLYKV